jgi:hypothetical protein
MKALRLTLVALFALFVGVTGLQAATSLAVNGTAALEGSYGLQVVFDGAGGDAYVQDNSPSGETRYVIQFRMNSAPATMATSSNHQIVRAISGDPTPTGVAFQVKIFRTAVGKELQVLARLDNGSFTNRIAVVGDSPTNAAYGVDWKASSAPGANDGFAKLYKQGTLRKELLNLDNDQQVVDMVRMGSFGAVDVSTTGSMYFDAFESYRTTIFP